MSAPTINPDFARVLEPLGNGAGDFFLAASLYHAHKEHFGHGFVVDDETVREDLRLVDQDRRLG